MRQVTKRDLPSCELDHKTDNNGRQNSPPITPQVDYFPHCGYDMPVNEVLRKDFNEVICSKCKKTFYWLKRTRSKVLMARLSPHGGVEKR